MATPHSVERTKEENHLGLSIVPAICQRLIVDVHCVLFSYMETIELQPIHSQLGMTN